VAPARPTLERGYQARAGRRRRGEGHRAETSVRVSSATPESRNVSSKTPSHSVLHANRQMMHVPSHSSDIPGLNANRNFEGIAEGQAEEVKVHREPQTFMI